MSQSRSPSAALRTNVAPRQFLTVLTALLFALAALSASAAAIHRIVQKGRAFSVPEIAIAQGDLVQFTNDDEFLHQIYVDSSRMSFDSDEQPPGQTIEVRFPVRGTFPVRCHIHPKMLLTVHVQ